MNNNLKGVVTGGAGGVIGALCCLGPTILIIIGIGAFFGINGACYTQYRPQFLILGLGFLATATFIYFRKKSSGTCEITPKGKIKFTGIAIISMLIVYIILILFVVPHIQAAYLPNSCST